MAGELNRSQASLSEVLGALKNYADTQQTTDEALIAATELYHNLKLPDEDIDISQQFPVYEVVPISGTFLAKLFSFMEEEEAGKPLPSTRQVTPKEPFIAQSFKWIQSNNDLRNTVVFEGVVDKDTLTYGTLELGLSQLALTKIVEKQGDKIISIWSCDANQLPPVLELDMLFPQDDCDSTITD